MDSSELKILPLKEDHRIRKLKRPINPILPDISRGATMLLVGKIKSGKSVSALNYYLNPNFYQGLFDSIYVISNTIFNDVSSRFLLDEPNVIATDTYSDELIESITNIQKEFPKEDQPLISIMADDIVNSVPRHGKLWSLYSRARHFNIGLLMTLVQSYKSVPPLVRSNLNALVIFWNNHSEAEKLKIAEDINHFVGGKFIELYDKHILYEPYAFMYINFETGKTYKNFDTLLWENTREWKENYEKNNN